MHRGNIYDIDNNPAPLATTSPLVVRPSVNQGICFTPTSPCITEDIISRHRACDICAEDDKELLSARARDFTIITLNPTIVVGGVSSTSSSRAEYIRTFVDYGCCCDIHFALHDGVGIDDGFSIGHAKEVSARDDHGGSGCTDNYPATSSSASSLVIRPTIG